MEETSKHSLEQEELHIASALSAVRTKFNEFASISSLPPEVLENIFSFCVSWLYHARKPSHRLAWTKVCRKWRVISLNTPLLWNTIDICHEPFASLCLSRSAAAPIHLFTMYPSKLRTANLLPEHTQRIKSIDVSLFPKDLEHLFAKCGPELMGLTSLSLRVPPVASNFFLDLSTRLPNLRRLAIQGVGIPYDMCIGLTHLSFCGLTKSHCPTVGQLLSILEASPYIEELNLHGISPEIPDPNTLPSQCVQLLHLSQFSLAGNNASSYQLQAILSSITLPLTSHLIIDSTQFATLTTLFPTDSVALYSNADLIIHEIHLKPDRACFFANLTGSHSVPLITITNGHSSFVRLFLTGFPPLLLTTITTLTMPDVLSDIPSVATVTDFFSHLPNLEMLTLPGISCLPVIVLGVLSKPAVIRQGLGEEALREGLLCHKLKSIYVGSFQLGDRSFEQEFTALLSDLVTSRLEAGIPIELRMQSGEIYDHRKHACIPTL